MIIFEESVFHNHPVSQITENCLKQGGPINMVQRMASILYKLQKKTTLSCLFGYPVFISNRTMLLCLSIMLMTRKNKINVNNKTNKGLT